MAKKPTYEELKQKINTLKKTIRDCTDAEQALKDYTAYQSVLATLRGVGPDESEENLLQALLTQIVNQYGFCMAWYGRYEAGNIRPMLSAGRVDKYLDGLVLKIAEPDSPDACCAMSLAVLDKTAFSYADLEKDKGFRAWRDYALELGYRSNLALPLAVNGQVEGGIMVYADTPHAFPPKRIERLQLLVMETGAILRERRLRATAEKALDGVLAGLEGQVAKRTADLATANDRLTRQIESQQHIQEALLESETKYSTLVEHANVGVVILRNRIFRYVNNALADITGYPVEQLLGMDFLHLIAPAYQPLVEQRYKARTAGKPAPSTYEIESLCRDGTTKNLALSVNNIQYRGRPATMAIVSDITQHKQIEGALKRQRDRAQKYLDIAGVIILTLDVQGTVTLINRKGCDVLGYNEKQIIGKNWFDAFLPARMRHDTEAVFQKLMAGQMQPYEHHENSVLTKDGRERIIAWHNALLTDDRGMTLGALSSGSDITERKQKELALKKADAELQAKTRNLEEVNTALRVLLQERERDKIEIEEKVLSNIKDLVTPYLERLKKTSLDGIQDSCVQILESNLHEIISPFAKKLSSKFLGLTPTEIQVANLVKDGRTSKEIAQFMLLSPKTVEFHRDNIRKKLGIKNKRVNLRTYLLSM
jgi:PAS domain S-box-containing protein